MPVLYIKYAVIDKLSKLGYTPQEVELPSIRGTFKETLLHGENIDVKVFSEREFEVKISQNNFFQILATDFHFSMQKVSEQSDFLSAPSKKTPIAWLLVSAYYSAFYAAVELSKLFGKYNLYLKGEHCRAILSQTSSSLNLESGNYIGVINYDVSDYITIRFSARQKSQPHDLAWRNMSEIINFHRRENIRDTKIDAVNFVKAVLNASNNILQTPNNVRNDWNYSYANAYDRSFCYDIEEVRTFLSARGRKSILSLPRNFKKYSNKQKDAYAIIYVEAILRQTMLDLKHKILN